MLNVRTFIDRPVLSIVISVAILIVGFIALAILPIEQFPDVAPPTVEVTASYPGASSETLEKSVIVPLEEAINGVENMTYISSSSANSGDAYISIYFKQGTDPDMAAVNVQNRVAKAQGLLPAEVTKIGVLTNKQQKSTLEIISLYSPTDEYDQKFLDNYFAINVIPRLKRIAGVGEVTLLGSNYSIRIWLKPDVMSQYGLTPSDVEAALAAQNIESATGSFGENYATTFQYAMKYKGRLSTPEAFDDIVIKAFANGEVLRLGEIAKIELGVESYNYNNWLNGHNGSTIMIFQTAGSNASEVIGNIHEQIDDMRKSLPRGIEFATVYSTQDFLDASMHQVVKTLFEAFILVVIIVLLFLRDWRSVLIPAISIIVSLVGTFAVMSVIGFTLNLLTLFALVLAIGVVVDDAIIVVEAVQARIDVGYRSAYQATIDAMGGITSAIITTTLVFMAVFVPVSMMSGTSGTFYSQFGLTMAAAVAISALNALTLSPALCALLLVPRTEGRSGLVRRLGLAFEASFSAVCTRYVSCTAKLVRHKPLVWVALSGSAVILALLMKTTKTGLVPDEDTGTVMVSVTTAPGSSLAQTTKILKCVEEKVAEIPEVASYSMTTGYGLIGGSGASNGMLILQLTPWSERKGDNQSASAVADKVNAIGTEIPDASIFAMTPPLIDGYGVSNGLEINLQNRRGGTLDSLSAVGTRFCDALMERPEISAAFTTFNVNFPQFTVEVDAVKCLRSGTTADAVLATLSSYYGGSYASNFNRFSKLYRVMVQASPEYRVTPESLNEIYTRTSAGMAPLSQFVSFRKSYGAETTNRFNLYSSMLINAEAADGYSSGDAIRAVSEVAGQTLPNGYGYEYSGISRETSETANNTSVIFLFCFVFVYLILCALFESFFLPLSVLLSVPFGLMGSFIFAKMMGLENNIYLQTGLIMLIGLLAKTAILITEYAVTRRRAGMTLPQAAVDAARARFRPIIMTVLAMVFGLAPLMFASGAGANGNSSLGSGVIGGLLMGSAALLFFVPVLFIVFQWMQEKWMPSRKR